MHTGLPHVHQVLSLKCVSLGLPLGLPAPQQFLIVLDFCLAAPHSRISRQAQSFLLLRETVKSKFPVTDLLEKYICSHWSLRVGHIV